MVKYPLKWHECLILLVLFVVLYFFTVTQRYYIPEVVRPFSLFVMVLLFLILFFFFIKPEKSFQLSRFLSLWLGIVVIVITTIKHVIIKFDLSYKSAIILTIAVVSPFITGFLYTKLNPAKN
jgi:hypothetical protein